MASKLDAELVQAFRAGDKRAGAELTERYYTKVLHFCRSKAPNAAKDLTHDSFAACFAKLPSLREASAFRSFLFGIVCNKIRMHYRSRRVEGERLDFGTVSSVDLDPSPSRLVAERGEQRMLLEALRRIPLQFQIVLELHYWQELRVREIAAALDIPESTVKTRMRRARQLLEQALAKLEMPGNTLESTLSDLEGWARSIREGVRLDS